MAEAPEPRPQPRPAPIPILARRPVPARTSTSGAPGTPAWVKAAAVGVFAAGLASLLAVKGLHRAQAPAPAAEPAAVTAPAPARPAFAPAPRLEPPPRVRVVEAVQTPESRTRILPDDSLVPLRAPAEASAPKPAASSLGEGTAREPRKVQAVKAVAVPIPRLTGKFNNDIFTRQEPPRRTVVAAPQEKTFIPAPCDWKVAAPGAPCWDSGGLMIKNQGGGQYIQGSGITVAPQQGPSGIWYQPGQAQQASAPAAPAKKQP